MIQEIKVCVSLWIICYAVFILPALLGISAGREWCEPTEISRLRYALGGGVACWLMEPITVRKGEGE